MAMVRIESVLCAIDLSDDSTEVLAWAGLFAGRFEAQLRILHAQWWEPPPYFTQSQVESLANQLGLQAESAREQTQALSEQALPAGLAFEVNVAQGHAIEVISAQLEERPPDLLVLGSHGRSGVSRMMLGSVAENVIRDSRVLSLVARTRGKRRRGPEIRKILVPVDFSEAARNAVDLASQVAGRFSARLVVFHSVDDGAETESVKEKLCDWLPARTERICEIEEVVRQGTPDERIVQLAQEVDADLIVMTAEHRPFLEWSTIGTTTERVMRHSPCSVLVQPEATG